MVRLTSLENTLHADRDGSARDRALAILRAARQQLLEELRKPSLPRHYQSISAQFDACLNAERVIERLWHRYHGDSPPCSASRSR